MDTLNHCYICKKETDLFCAHCQKGLCSKHKLYINHHFFCSDCFIKERKKGLIIILSLTILIVIAAILVFVFVKK